MTQDEILFDIKSLEDLIKQYGDIPNGWKTKRLKELKEKLKRREK